MRFVTSYFGPSGHEQPTTLWAAKELAENYPETHINIVVSDLSAILADISSAWRELSKCANIYFATEDDARRWLSSLIEAIESERLKM
jgi:hypothetical protein